jgi:hypothetical protein
VINWNVFILKNINCPGNFASHDKREWWCWKFDHKRCCLTVHQHITAFIHYVTWYIFNFLSGLSILDCPFEKKFSLNNINCVVLNFCSSVFIDNIQIRCVLVFFRWRRSTQINLHILANIRYLIIFLYRKLKIYHVT